MESGSPAVKVTLVMLPHLFCWHHEETQNPSLHKRWLHPFQEIMNPLRPFPALWDQMLIILLPSLMGVPLVHQETLKQQSTIAVLCYQTQPSLIRQVIQNCMQLCRNKSKTDICMTTVKVDNASKYTMQYIYIYKYILLYA